MKRLLIALAALMISGSAMSAPLSDRLPLYHKLDAICRGSSDPIAVDYACKARGNIGESINNDGLCYGKKAEYRNEYAWHKCTNGSVRIKGGYNLPKLSANDRN